MNTVMLRACCDELEKIALNPSVLGAGIGAAGGAALGALKAPKGHRGKGALLGGAAGGALGAAAPKVFNKLPSGVQDAARLASNVM